MAIEIVSDEAAGDAFDTMTAKLHQLQAMLMLTYGEQGRTFRKISIEAQENFMWSCFSMVDECLELTHKFVPAGIKGDGNV